MDFHLDTLLGLPNATVFSYASELDFIILKLQLIGDGINCSNCNYYTDTVHQTRPILIRDLSIFGQLVYLKVPRRQFYCPNCKKSPTEPLSWLNKKQRQTTRYQEYIHNSHSALQLLRHVLVTKTRQFSDTTNRNSLTAAT